VVVAAGSRSIEHIGSAHDDAELAALKAAAAQRLAAGQTELDFGLPGVVGPGTLPILSSQMTHLWDGLCAAYRLLGFESATKGDNVFGDLVLARIIEPTSKLDAARVISEVGVEPSSYATIKRRLPVYAKPAGVKRWLRQAPPMPSWGQRRWCLFDVSTLYKASRRRPVLAPATSRAHRRDQRKVRALHPLSRVWWACHYGYPAPGSETADAAPG
jgi:hypothetical protein